MTIHTFDTETWLLVPGCVAPPVVCLSYSEGDDSGVLDKAAGLAWLSSRLASDDLIIGHNVAYDFGVCCEADPSLLLPTFEAYRRNRVSDTQLREQLIQNSRGNLRRLSGKGSSKAPGRGFSLAAILYRRFGEDRWQEKGADAWRLRYGTLDGVPLDQWPEDARDYPLADAVDTERVWIDQCTDIPDMIAAWAQADGNLVSEMHEDYSLALVINESDTCRAAWALHLMGCWGLRTDPDYVEQAAAKWETEIQRLDSELVPAGLVREVGGSKNTQAARDRVIAACAALGIEVPLTDTGIKHLEKGTPLTEDLIEKYAKTDSDTLLICAEADPILATLQERNSYTKGRSSYLDKMLRAGTTRPVTPRWGPLVETGRTSCSKPPLQQTPKHHDPVGIRPCFVPRPGFLFAAADYGTAELRALAFICYKLFGVSKMRDALIAGQDLHWLFAAWMLGVSYEDVFNHPEGPLMRQTAKAANFGFPGGMGARKFALTARKQYRVDVGGVEGAKALKQQWLDAWPEMRLYFDFIANATADGSFTAVQFGSGRIRGGCGYCDGANTYFQGLVADGAKAALFAVSYECYTGLRYEWDPKAPPSTEPSPLAGSRPVAFVHDEIILETPEGVAPEAADRMAALMIEGMQRYIKADIPITVDPALMRRWYPKADTVRDEDGRLAVWSKPDK